MRYKPRLTAASYRYFLRGANEKAAADDFCVAARRRARLAPFDRALRQFRCAALQVASLSFAQHLDICLHRSVLPITYIAYRHVAIWDRAGRRSQQRLAA